MSKSKNSVAIQAMNWACRTRLHPRESGEPLILTEDTERPAYTRLVFATNEHQQCAFTGTTHKQCAFERKPGFKLCVYHLGKLPKET